LSPDFISNFSTNHRSIDKAFTAPITTTLFHSIFLSNHQTFGTTNIEANMQSEFVTVYVPFVGTINETIAQANL